MSAEVNYTNYNYINENILGLDYNKQLEIFNMYYDILKNIERTDLLEEFNEQFEKYLERINTIVTFKSDYYKLNNIQKKFLYDILQEEIRELINDTHYNKYGESLDQVNERYIHYYGGDSLSGFDGERYFYPASIESGYVDNYIEQFSNLSLNEQVSIIEDTIYYFCNLDDNYLYKQVCAKQMDKKFDTEMKDLLKSFYPHYLYMTPEKKMDFIYSLEFWKMNDLSDLKEDINNPVTTNKKRNIKKKQMHYINHVRR